MRLKPLPCLVVLLLTAACAVPDATKQEGAAVAPHEVLEVLPESYREGGANFTGVIVYGDKGYTGLVGDIHYPSVKVDGNPVGKCQKRKAMVIPLTPGSHVVSAHSENKVEHGVTLPEGGIAYFRCSFLRIGGIIYPPAVLAPADAATAYAVVNAR
ncbi:hypothetical protein DZK27_03300 [Rhodobacteraceae bacterium 63075]|nr:hypothetical protein DZK27_03300 [Rhodobacteraceae bacterium 63075]